MRKLPEICKISANQPQKQFFFQICFVETLRVNKNTSCRERVYKEKIEQIDRAVCSADAIRSRTLSQWHNEEWRWRVSVGEKQNGVAYNHSYVYNVSFAPIVWLWCFSNANVFVSLVWDGDWFTQLAEFILICKPIRSAYVFVCHHCMKYFVWFGLDDWEWSVL